MKIYYADIRGANEARAKYPPQSDAPGSAFGTSLLAVAYEDYTKSKLPKILRALNGKPFFKDTPSLHFSISHSRTHVLCALSETPIGADTTDHRPVSEATIKALASPEELQDFTIHELWSIREAVYKLTGQGDLRTMRIKKEDGKIIPPNQNIRIKLYKDIENSSTAIASHETDFPEKLIKVSIDELFINN